MLIVMATIDCKIVIIYCTCVEAMFSTTAVRYKDNLRRTTRNKGSRGQGKCTQNNKQK